MSKCTKTGGTGINSAIVLLEGYGCYAEMRFENGVHRVQRVPVTEANGRMHTSTVSLAVLPEPEKIAHQRLAAMLLKQQVDEATRRYASNRTLRVGTMERAEKIRTYNYKGNRMTDHRLKLTRHGVEQFLAGGEQLEKIGSHLYVGDQQRLELVAMSDTRLCAQKVLLATDESSNNATQSRHEQSSSSSNVLSLEMKCQR